MTYEIKRMTLAKDKIEQALTIAGSVYGPDAPIMRKLTEAIKEIDLDIYIAQKNAPRFGYQDILSGTISERAMP